MLCYVTLLYVTLCYLNLLYVMPRYALCSLLCNALCSMMLCLDSAGGPEGDGLQRGGDPRRVPAALRRPPDGEHRVHDCRWSPGHLQRR